MSLRTGNNQSKSLVTAVHSLEKLWRCRECGDKYDDQAEAITHHVKKHQEDVTNTNGEE